MQSSLNAAKEVQWECIGPNQSDCKDHDTTWSKRTITMTQFAWCWLVLFYQVLESLQSDWLAPVLPLFKVFRNLFQSRTEISLFCTEVENLVTRLPPAVASQMFYVFCQLKYLFFFLAEIWWEQKGNRERKWGISNSSCTEVSVVKYCRPFGAHSLRRAARISWRIMGPQ